MIKIRPVFWAVASVVGATVAVQSIDLHPARAETAADQPPHMTGKLTVDLDPQLPTRTRPWNKVVQVETDRTRLYSIEPKLGWLQAHGAIPGGGLGNHEVNLTFDDGPQPHNKTTNVLKILKSAGLRVNYFMMGKNAFFYKNIAKKVAAAGHVIGSHSVTHPIMRHPTPEFAREQISCGSYLVAKSAGLYVPFFRFPGGEVNDVSYEVLKKTRESAFFWDVDSTDSQPESTPELIYSRVMKQLEANPKGVILFHDVWPHTAIALPYILEALYRKNFTVVVYEPKKPDASGVGTLSEPGLEGESPETALGYDAANPSYADAPEYCKKTVKDLEEGRSYEYSHFGPDDRE